MSTHKLQLRGVVDSRAAADALMKNLGDAVIIVRGVPRWLLMLCPCGCGDVLPINLDRRAGKAWRLYMNKRHGVSVFPSIWRDTGCESHFVIWRSQISLFDRHRDDDLFIDAEELNRLTDMVRKTLQPDRPRSYVDIADELEAIPWDVLRSCRRLVQQKEAAEGAHEHRGEFRALTNS